MARWEAEVFCHSSVCEEALGKTMNRINRLAQDPSLLQASNLSLAKEFLSVAQLAVSQLKTELKMLCRL